MCCHSQHNYIYQARPFHLIVIRSYLLFSSCKVQSRLGNPWLSFILSHGMYFLASVWTKRLDYGVPVSNQHYHVFLRDVAHSILNHFIEVLNVLVWCNFCRSINLNDGYVHCVPFQSECNLSFVDGVIPWNGLCCDVVDDETDNHSFFSTFLPRIHKHRLLWKDLVNATTARLLQAPLCHFLPTPTQLLPIFLLPCYEHIM